MSKPEASYRGLTDEEIAALEGKPLNAHREDTSAVAVKSIIRFGAGYIDLALADGSKIRRQGGTIAWRQNNPGNIKHGDFASNHGSVGSGGGGHAVFSTYEKGKEAKRALLFTAVRDYNTKTIAAAIAKYAPTSDGNNPTKYANFIAKRVGVPINTVLKTLTAPQQDKMLAAMEVYEGFKVGKVTKL